MIEGLSHITFIVKNLERSAEFFKTVLLAEEIYSSDEKEYSISKERFFLVGGVWIAIMEGDSLADTTYNHVAFKISQDDMQDYQDRIRNFGLRIQKGRSRVRGEAESIYFYDDDNHLFELHSGTLETRLKTYTES